MSRTHAKLGRTIRLNITFTLTDESRDILSFEDRVFLRKRRGESMHHVAMKLMSYFVFFRDGLEIERSADQHYKPDLVHLDDAGEPTIWIDCGATTIRKLEKIVAKNRDTEFVIVKPTERMLHAYRNEAIKKTPNSRIEYLSFSDRFIDDICGPLEGRHAFNVVISDDVLFAEIDDAMFECEIVRLSGEEI